MKTPGATKIKQPLDDVMLAMDVVDTLRYRQRMVEQELDSENREQALKERLRKIYKAQGIDVPDHIIEEGVAALKEDRFAYTPVPDSLYKKLALIYVNRHQWGKWLFGLLFAAIIGWGTYHFAVVAPRTALPEKIEAVHRVSLKLAKSERARKLIDQKYFKAKAALRDGDFGRAEATLKSLNQLQASIEQEYSLLIVSRPGQKSGVWRIPDINTRARNYYIIVRAVDSEGRTLKVPVVNEETGKTETVSEWGVRVDKRVFDQIRADKLDDGIIQKNYFGIKRSGYIKPEYFMPTTGATITQW